jgi:hypothetical protein
MLCVGFLGCAAAQLSWYVRRHCALVPRFMRLSLVALVVGSVAGCGEQPLRVLTVSDLAGCYELTFGSPSRWPELGLPAIDSSLHAPRLRLVLREVPDTTAPQQPAFTMDAGRVPTIGYSYWRPFEPNAFIAARFDVDLGWRMRLDQKDEGRFVGTARSEGTLEGGSMSRRVAARRVGCPGFVPGYLEGMSDTVRTAYRDLALKSRPVV